MPTTDHAHRPNSTIAAAASIVTLNVGGRLFQTTSQTLCLAGPNSVLSTLSTTTTTTPFIDRDPDLFAALLSLLRTGRLPSSSKPAAAGAFDLQDLVSEAQFYGIDGLLLSCLSNPSQFDAFDLQKSLVLPLSGRDSPSAVATTPSGSVHVAHGSKITSFDWSLRKKLTLLTGFTVVDSLLALSPSAAAAGATDFPGLQILDLEKGAVRKTLHWAAANPSRNASNSMVQAIGSSSDLLFGSFESFRRNSSAIVAFDLGGGTFRPVTEVGRQEVYGAEIDSAIPASKLRWVSASGLLMAAGSHSGPSGLVGNIRLWDVRSSNAVWQLHEKHDCFADVTVSESLHAIFKVGVNSGEVYMVDLRKLGLEDNPWVCLGNGRRGDGGGGKKEGSGCRIESHGDKVFCTKDGDVELWTEVVVGGGGWDGSDQGDEEGRVMRRNLMGRVRDVGGSKITDLAFGGNRMVLTRKDQQCVEVWESAVRL